MGTLLIFYGGTKLLNRALYKRISYKKALSIVANLDNDVSWRYFTKTNVITHGFVECAVLCGGRWNKGCYRCTITEMGKTNPLDMHKFIG